MPQEPTWVSCNVLLLSILRTELPGSISSFTRRGWYDLKLLQRSGASSLSTDYNKCLGYSWCHWGAGLRERKATEFSQRMFPLGSVKWACLEYIIRGCSRWKNRPWFECNFPETWRRIFFFWWFMFLLGNSLTQSLPGSKFSMTVSYNIFIDLLLVDDSRNFRVELDTSDVTTAPTQVLAPSRYQQTSSPFKYQKRFY